MKDSKYTSFYQLVKIDKNIKHKNYSSTHVKDNERNRYNKFANGNHNDYIIILLKDICKRLVNKKLDYLKNPEPESRVQCIKKEYLDEFELYLRD